MIAGHGFTLMSLNFGSEYSKPRVREALAYIEQSGLPEDVVLVVPAVLPCPLETMGDLLVWRYYAGERQGLLTPVANSPADLLRALPERLPTGRNLWVVLQHNAMNRESCAWLLKELAQRYQPVEARLFGSRMRDFTLEVWRYTASVE